MPGNIGPLEIIIVLIIALVVFGPKRLPELGSSLGRGIREFRNTVTGDKHDDEPEDDAKALSASNATAAPAEAPAKSEAAPDKRT
jgi:sec-independent protein translocase protein TatA